MSVELKTPLNDEVVRKLHCGDQVLLRGTIFTARDAVHKHLFESKNITQSSEWNLENAVFYHCGPVMLKDANGNWQITAAGPTTSNREEPYMATLIEQYHLRAIIGKGGMGAKTLAACVQFGCVYLHATGGCAQVLASAVKRIRGVQFLERFGIPEAMWALEVENFPVTVTMDSYGKSLHCQVQEQSKNELQKLG